MRRIFSVVGRQIAQQRLGDLDRVTVILGDEVDIAADRGVHLGAADLVQTGGASGDRLDHLWASDEHVGVLLGHDDVVHQRRRIRRATGAGTGDDGDLRHHARQQHVVIEHLAVAGQSIHRFLDAGARRVFKCNDGSADFQRKLHRLDDLPSVHLAKRTTHDREVLAERRHRPTVHEAGADDDAVRGQFFVGQAEMLASVLGMGGDFLEGIRLKQRQQPLARAQ